MKGFVGNQPRLKSVLSLREHFCVPQVSKAAKCASSAAFPGTGGRAAVRKHNSTGSAEWGRGGPVPVSAPGEPRSTDWAPGPWGCLLAPGQERSDLRKDCAVVPPLSAALPALLKEEGNKCNHANSTNSWEKAYEPQKPNRPMKTFLPPTQLQKP